MEVPLRRQFGLPCALRFFSVLLVLGLTLRQDEDIESLTADQTSSCTFNAQHCPGSNH